jgi:hypothetical protein
LVSLDHVQNWADEQISSVAKPPYWLIEVSLAKTPVDAVAALGEVPGTANALSVWNALMRSWLELLQNKPESDSEIAKHLYFMGMDGRAPIQGIDDELMRFWDAIDLARDGVYGFPETEREKLREFLVRWAR